MPMEGMMILTKSERMELQRQAGARNTRADSARHARLILLLAEGLTWGEIRAKLDCSDSYIDRWSKRFAADRLAGLFARYAGRERYKVTDRTDPVLPLSPGRAERHGFEYFRHGTLSLYAAFNTKTGEVLGKTAERHTSAEFVAFLTDIVANQPKGKEIHLIADNLSAHKSAPVKDFPAAHPKVHLHFTPTYSSWLNQVELWFGKIERDVIARGVFTSVADLKKKLLRYIRQYNKSPRTVKWKYADPSKHISTQLVGTGH